MASADLCNLTRCITAGRAVWPDGFGPVRSLEIGLLDLAPGRIRYGTTQPSLPSVLHRQGAQISSGRCAHLSVHKRRIYRRLRTGGLCCHLPPVICHRQQHPSALTMRLLFVASHLFHSGFLRTIPRGFALAFGSWLSLLTLSPSLYSRRGLPPHKFAPMLGAHPSIERTCQRSLRAFWPAAHVER